MLLFSRAALAALFCLAVLSSPSPALAAPKPVPEELTSTPGFYEGATPDDVRELLKGVSLKGVFVAEGEHYTALTPLMRAAMETRYPEVIDILIEAGCDVNALAQPLWSENDPPREYDTERTALHFAMQNSKIGVLRRVLSHKPDVNVIMGGSLEFTPLYTAARDTKGADRFIALLEAGADPDLKHPRFADPDRRGALLLWAEFVGQGGLYDASRDQWRKPADVARMSEALIARGVVPDSELLASALSRGENDAALMMLKAGASPRGEDVLWAAFQRSQTFGDDRPLADPSPEIVALLLPHNDVNAPDPRTGLTPLRAACRAGMDPKVAALLVEAGARLDPEADKRTRSMPGYMPDNILLRDAMESKRDNPELVRYLLSQGISAATNLNEEPLFLASRGYWPKPLSAVELVKAGADPMLLRQDRYTRAFAREAGILDKDDAPLVLTEDERARQVVEARLPFERMLMREWALQHPRQAVISRAFYRCATPDDVREVLGLTPPGSRPAVSNPPTRRSGGLFIPSTSSLAEAAGYSPYPEVIDILIEAGAKLGAPGDKTISFMFGNRNPHMVRVVLHHMESLSALYEHPAWVADARPSHVSMLREAGLDLSAGLPSGSVLRETESSFIVEAARWGNTPFVRALMRAGVDLNRADSKGNRVLDYLIQDEHYDLALEILAAGAECDGRNGNGPLLEYASRQTPRGPAAGEYPLFMERLRACVDATAEMNEEPGKNGKNEAAP